LKSNEGVKEAWITNLLERQQEKMIVENDTIRLKFKPFEIHTLMLTIKR
jgi:hypothetical protein